MGGFSKSNLVSVCLAANVRILFPVHALKSPSEPINVRRVRRLEILDK